MGEEFYHAVTSGNVRRVRELIASGADPNAYPRQDGVPLVDAIRVDNPELIRALVEGGANPNIKHEYYANLMQAAADMRSPKVIPFLLKLGEDPNEKFEGTPVLNAVLLFEEEEYESIPDRIKAARALIRAGADVNISTALGTPSDIVLDNEVYDELIPDLIAGGAPAEPLLEHVEDREKVKREASEAIGEIAANRRAPLTRLRKSRKLARAGRRKTRRRKTQRRRSRKW